MIKRISKSLPWLIIAICNVLFIAIMMRPISSVLLKNTTGMIDSCVSALIFLACISAVGTSCCLFWISIGEIFGCLFKKKKSKKKSDEPDEDGYKDI